MQPDRSKTEDQNAIPGKIVLSLILVQFLVWTIPPALTYTAPPLDVVEAYVSAGEWSFGTHKHPPLPSWVLGSAALVTDSVIWAPLIFSQICIALTYLFVYQLGRRLLGASRAALGTALLVGVYYFSVPTPEFNHNVLQMPIWAGGILAFYIAISGNRLLPWILLGLAAGLGLLTKYSAIVPFALMGLWLLSTRNGRQHLAGFGPWLAVLIGILLFLPHIIWLVENDFLPLHYAARRSTGADLEYGQLVPVLGFIGAQLADHAALVVLLAIGGLIGRTALSQWSSMPDKATRFLMTFGLAPVLVTVLAALIAGMGLRDMWGTPMFALSGLLAVALVSGRLTPARYRRSIIACFVLLLAVPVIVMIVLSNRADRTKPPRALWPAADIAAAAHALWADQTSVPMAFVAGHEWSAGLVSLYRPATHPRPRVIQEANLTFTPWIDVDDTVRQGVLYIWHGNINAPPPFIAPHIKGLKRHNLTIDRPAGPALTFGVALRPPQS